MDALVDTVGDQLRLIDLVITVEVGKEWRAIRMDCRIELRNRAGGAEAGGHAHTAAPQTRRGR